MIRKCKAAQEGLCRYCETVCPACGTKKYSVDENCALCMYCEEQNPVKQDNEKEQDITVIAIKKDKSFIKGD